MRKVIAIILLSVGVSWIKNEGLESQAPYDWIREWKSPTVVTPAENMEALADELDKWHE